MEDEIAERNPFTTQSLECTRNSLLWKTWPRCKKNGVKERDCICKHDIPLTTYSDNKVQDDVREFLHEKFPAAWLSAEGGNRRKAWRIVTMATRLLVSTRSVVLPVEYSFFCPLPGAAWAMDRFVPSSRQPQHWSRNYHGSHERRRSLGRQKSSPDTQDKSSSSFIRGVTLRAEDLLGGRENQIGPTSKLSPVNYLEPNPGDHRRLVLGGSATELTHCERPRAAPRRSSEGGYTLRRKSSSSSNAADDPTSSENSTSCSTSSSSSSESGCNGDSETCNYCPLSESSDCKDSTTDEDRRSSPSPVETNAQRPRLIRALSEDCNPPSRTRPHRRTSPGEYLRHKRDQMEKLRLQRCDSDPRLTLRRREKSTSPNRTPAVASPNRSRIRRTRGRPHKPEASQSEDILPVDKVILPVPPFESTQAEGKPVERPKRSALAKNIAERKSKRNDTNIVWNGEDATPFLECGSAAVRCTICEYEIPYAQCIVCSAEARGASCFIQEEDGTLEVFYPEGEVARFIPGEELVDKETSDPVPESINDSSKLSTEKKELEEFYDSPTPVNSPTVLPACQTTDEKRIQWTSKGSIHKSFNFEEKLASRRRSSAQLRKYNSEPIPDNDRDECSSSSTKTQSTDAENQSCDTAESRRSSASSTNKHERKTGYHVAKDSPKKESSEQDSQKSLLLSGRSSENEDEKESQSRVLYPNIVVEDKSVKKNTTFLTPDFVFEPEIIHKANPTVDEADIEVIPSAVGAFRRLSEEEFIASLNIHEAAKKGDLHVVKLLTKKDPKQMETVDERGWTPIHVAAAHGHTEVVKFLALEGAHLAALDPSSYTPLHLAAMNGHNPCVEVLLPMGVDIDSITAEGFTPLHLAVMNVHLECIQTLLQWGSSLDKRDALGRNVQDMVEEYNLEEVAALLRRFHKQLHKFKHMLDMMQRNEDRSSSEIPREFMDILASIAEESGTE